MKRMFSSCKFKFSAKNIIRIRRGKRKGCAKGGKIGTENENFIPTGGAILSVEDSRRRAAARDLIRQPYGLPPSPKGKAYFIMSIFLPSIGLVQ